MSCREKQSSNPWELDLYDSLKCMLHLLYILNRQLLGDSNYNYNYN